MSSNTLIGRELEYRRLDRCLEEEQAQLVVVYGRRRVGKTYLVNQYFNGRFDFKFTGGYKLSKEAQLKNFAFELSLQSQEKCETPKDWSEAFLRLRKYLSACPDEEKRVVFFDEMPWMDTPRSDFLPSFEWFWNSWGSAQRNLLFVVCGSATSWMAKNISENQGGLFNRQTCRLYLNPFSLSETEQYLHHRGMEWSRYDLAECYMVMGGIPYYLSLLDPELSYVDNIDNLFFRKRAELWDEFTHLYQTLFKNSGQYIQVTEALSKKKSGLTREEVSDMTGLDENGAMSKILKDLTDSGFVRANAYYQHKKKETRYQLSDYYSMFYYHFIKDNYGRDEHFWRNTLDNPQRRVWAGLIFEQVCRDHIIQIKQKLGIQGVLSEEFSWHRRRGKSGEDLPGAQIDLIIDRRDRVINICEIKFSINEYEINREYEQKLRNKIDAFRNDTGTKKTLNLTMITTFGVKNNKYSSIVRNQVCLNDLFEGLSG